MGGLITLLHLLFSAGCWLHWDDVESLKDDETICPERARESRIDKVDQSKKEISAAKVTCKIVIHLYTLSQVHNKGLNLTITAYATQGILVGEAQAWSLGSLWTCCRKRLWVWCIKGQSRATNGLMEKELFGLIIPNIFLLANYPMEEKRMQSCSSSQRLRRRSCSSKRRLVGNRQRRKPLGP